MAIRIPWTEKYRPVTLDDVVGNPNIINTLKGFILTQVIPQLIILWGLPGIGKTSAAFAFARDYYIRKGIYDKEGKIQPGFFPPLMVMRGAVGIETIRTRVHEFMRHAPPPGARRIVIFDEAEMMSKEALLELRPYIERYAKTCSIIFTTNVNPATWLDFFDPLLAAVRDRALIYQFLLPTTEEIARLLSRIVREEEFEIPEERIGSIASKAEGSVRKAVELLQAEYARIVAEKPPEVPLPPVKYTVEDLHKREVPESYIEEIEKGIRNRIEEIETRKVCPQDRTPVTLDVWPLFVCEDGHKTNVNFLVDIEEKPPVPEIEAPPVELPRIHATLVDVGKYKAGEYYIMLLNPEKYGDRPILSAMRRTIKDVEEYVALGKELYDPVALGLYPEPGELWWEELPEELKHKAEIYWTAEDVEWNPEVEADRVIYHRIYVRGDLEPLKVDELKRICTVKTLRPVGKKAELINRILGKPPPKPPEKPPVPPPVAIPPPVEKGLRKADEEELRTEFKADLLRRDVSPRKWMPIFDDELTKWRRELAEIPSEAAKKAAKADLIEVIRGILEKVERVPVGPPIKRPPEIPRIPEIPVPARVEFPVEREADVVTRRCWKCDEPFESDRTLEARVRESITEIRGRARMTYHGPLLRFPMLFYYLCEKCRHERFGYRDIYDAIAFRIAEARTLMRPEKAYTKETLRERGFTPEDIAEIQIRMKLYD